eukprot:351043-Chlamydomonas_euryale.AAC.2
MSSSLPQTFLDKKDPQNITLEALMKNDVMGVLCCPLASDPVPGVQSLSLSCLSKLAGADPLLSQVIVTCGVLDSVVQSMSHDSPPVQAAADGVLSAVARSTTDNAHNVMMAGACMHERARTRACMHVLALRSGSMHAVLCTCIARARMSARAWHNKELRTPYCPRHPPH